MAKRRVVFVFGSNLAGRHGKGAALHARQYHHAEYGVGAGPTGNAYAIPTKDAKLETLPLSEIEAHVGDFLEYARRNPEITFEVTRVGCGLAGYTDADMAPMFRDAPSNCFLPIEWKESRHGNDRSRATQAEQLSAAAGRSEGHRAPRQ